MAFARCWALVTAELMCALGFKSSVTVMSKSMPILVMCRTLFRICKLESGTILLPIFTTEHLLTEILNCHKSSQLANASSARCSCCTSQLFKTRIKIFTSSANNLTQTPNCFNASTKSLMNITNIMGPMPLPWMTPCNLSSVKMSELGHNSLMTFVLHIY